jgi:hypothetical protein
MSALYLPSVDAAKPNNHVEVTTTRILLMTFPDLL